MIPDLSVFWVIFFVLLLAYLLNQLLFKPLTRVISAREGAVQSARQLADSANRQAQEALEEFEARTRAARAEVHQQMEVTRRAAEQRRASLVAEARQQSEGMRAEAASRLAQETDTARQRISLDADVLADVIAARILGRQTT